MQMWIAGGVVNTNEDAEYDYVLKTGHSGEDVSGHDQSDGVGRNGAQGTFLRVCYGGHVNPAVTVGLVLGGQITILKGVLYWIAQLVGAIVACLLLKFVTGGLVRCSYKFPLV